MTTADFAVISDRAIMSAGIVYALALLAHLLEWPTSLSRATDHAEQRERVDDAGEHDGLVADHREVGGRHGVAFLELVGLLAGLLVGLLFWLLVGVSGGSLCAAACPRTS